VLANLEGEESMSTRRYSGELVIYLEYLDDAGQYEYRIRPRLAFEAFTAKGRVAPQGDVRIMPTKPFAFDWAANASLLDAERNGFPVDSHAEPEVGTSNFTIHRKVP
jgi:hypothetical protein